jgi:hypothetical protein
MGLYSRDKKTAELFLYITKKLSGHDTYGAIVLNKAFYFIDNVSYLKRGKPISTFKYICQRLGPTPKPVDFLSLKDNLILNGWLQPVNTEYFGRIQTRLIPKRDPDYSVFDKEEILIIDEIIESIVKYNGRQISDLTHKFPSWKAATEKEELPFFTFLLSSKSPSQSDIDWGLKVMANA